MMKSTLAIGAAALALTSMAQAAVFSADFDTGTDGFTANGFTLSQATDNSFAGGYIELYDGKWGNGTLRLGKQYLNPLTAGGSISFDAITLGDVVGTHRRFGEITLKGGGFKATYDAISGVPVQNMWQTFTVGLNAADWGLSEQNFSTMLSNLSSFSMILETKNGLGERVGIDNFRMANGANAAVPVPAGAFLFAPAAAALYMRRQRRSEDRRMSRSKAGTLG